MYVCFSYRADNVIGRRLRGPGHPYYFIGSRKHTRNYQFSNVNCPSFFHLYRLYLGRQYQQGSTNHVREHWFTKRCLYFAQSLTLSVGSWLTPELGRIVLSMSLFPCSNSIVVSWEQDLSNSTYKFNGILRFWPFLLCHGWITLIRI